MEAYVLHINKLLNSFRMTYVRLRENPVILMSTDLGGSKVYILVTIYILTLFSTGRARLKLGCGGLQCQSRIWEGPG